MTRLPAYLIAALCSAGALAQEIDALRAALRQQESRRCDMLAQAATATVCVLVDRQATSGGSGVIIHPDGYGLTNFHVIESALTERRAYGGLSDGRLYPLRVLGIDAAGDVAMFKLDGRDAFPHAPLGDSDNVRVGQPVAALGNPFLLAEDFVPTVTFGYVSGVQRYQEGQQGLLEYADCIQVSTSINPGNSGGPLFDLEGRVVGINGRISTEERGRVNVGLGYAISINQIRRFLPALRAGHWCEHGTLGMTVEAYRENVRINAIQQFSPAERAGAQLGDVVLRVAGRKMRSPNDLSNVVTPFPADWPILLALQREQQQMTLVARTERVPLRVPRVYDLDLELNRAELSALLERHALRGDWRRATDAALCWRLTPDGADPVSVCPDTAAAPDWALEWQRLAQLLLAAPQFGAGWELGRGDELDGRLAQVIEHRDADGRRTRWLLEWGSDALLGVYFGDADEPRRVLWQPLAPSRDFGAGRCPPQWQRVADGATLRVTVSDISAAPAGGGE